MNSTDTDRNEGLRQRLQARGAELRERVQRVRQDLGRETNPLPRDSSDAAIALENDEILEAIEDSALREINHIERALARMDSGRLDDCERCDEKIDEARRRAVMYATLCRNCAGDA